MKKLPRGLYVITDAGLIPDEVFAERIEQALRGGARWVQYRDKRLDPNLRTRLARELVDCCRRFGAVSIINDDVDLAAHVCADGVHLGMDDSSPRDARAKLGADAVIGVSCYNQLERAQHAVEQGADYVAFGSFFPSKTKPHAPRADINLLRYAREHLQVPLCAIGGIKAENAKPLLDAGADMLAVISDVFAQQDIEAAARRFSILFD